MRRLKSNDRLTLFLALALALLPWLAAFGYGILNTAEDSPFYVFLIFFLLFVNTAYVISKLLTNYFHSVMEIRRKKLIQDIREANERWGFKQ